MNGACLNSKWRSDKKYLQIIHIFLWPGFLPTIRSAELPRAFLPRALHHCAAIRVEGLLSRVVYARKFIIRAENSSCVGKLTAVSSETPRWRRVLQRKATVNFNVLEDEEVQVQSQKLLTVLQINRVYNFVWVYPKYKQGITWSDLLDEIYLQTKAITITWNLLYCNCQ